MRDQIATLAAMVDFHNLWDDNTSAIFGGDPESTDKLIFKWSNLYYPMKSTNETYGM